MLKKADIHLSSTSDKTLIELIGNFIKDSRLQQNKSQEQVADAAGINRGTLSQIENGEGGTLLTLMQILRALNLLHVLENFQTQQQISPLQLAKLQKQARVRASGSSNVNLKNK